MKPGTLYLFHKEFFTNKDTSQEFISQVYSDLKTYSSSDLKFQLLGKASLIDEICKSVKEKISLARLRVAQANILNHAALAFDKKELSDLSLEKINSIEEADKVEWDQGLEYGYYFVRGNINLFRYEFISDDEDYNYTLDDLNYIMNTKYCYTQLFESYLKGRISLKGNNTKSLVVNYARTLGFLSRYVEPFYYLENLLKHHSGHNGDIKLAKVLMYDSIKDKTCDSYSPVLSLRIDRDIRSIRKDKNFKSYDRESLEELSMNTRKDFENYKKEHGLGRNEIASISKELDAESRKIKGYKKFIIINKLGLNQHGIYCNCEKGLLDDLNIRSGHLHTHIPWTNRFEILIDAIKVDFESARRKYYDSSKVDNDDEYNIVVIDQSIKDDGILLSKSSSLIKESFNKCLSILDSIANVYNYAHELVPDEKRSKVDFITFFNRRVVKQHIENMDGNLFSGALYSISKEFNTESKFSMFKDLKKWRNAFEHDSLLLTSTEVNVLDLSLKYPEVRAFVPKIEFTNKTMFLLHLTRSAIFSLVWDLRKVTKLK